MINKKKEPNKKVMLSHSVKIHLFTDIAVMIITDIVVRQKLEHLSIRYRDAQLMGKILTLMPFVLIITLFSLINYLFNKNKEPGNIQMHIFFGPYLVYITALLLVSIFWDGFAPAAAELYFHFY